MRRIAILLVLLATPAPAQEQEFLDQSTRVTIENVKLRLRGPFLYLCWDLDNTNRWQGFKFSRFERFEVVIQKATRGETLPWLPSDDAMCTS